MNPNKIKFKWSPLSYRKSLYIKNQYNFNNAPQFNLIPLNRPKTDIGG